MSLTELAVKKNVLTFSIIVAMCFTGYQTYTNLARESMPETITRNANIVTRFPGASPERIELLITDRIEKVVQEMPEIDFISSTSKTGISIITVKFKDEYKQMRPIFDDLRRKVEAIDDLPDGSKKPKINDDLGDLYGIMVGISGDDFSLAELKDVADDLRDELIRLDDAAKVEMVGNREEQIFIEYDDAKLATMGLSKSIVSNLVASQNILFSGGDLNLQDEKISLEPTGNFESIDDIKNMIISTAAGGQAVYLGDITTIYRAYKDPPESIVRVDGKQAIVLGVSLKEGGNIIELGKKVDRVTTEQLVNFPIGIDFNRVADLDVYINKSVDNFTENLVQAIVVVLIVMFLFLGLRTGIIVASLIPTTIVFTFVLMAVFDQSINQVTLAALIMALGMLVDNAIVVTESILGKVERGIDNKTAALDSAKEMFVPLMVSSLTTSAAFLPFFLAASSMGEIVGPLFVVISIALIMSWLLSVTFIPLLSIFFLNVQKKQEDAKPSIFDRISVYYEKLINYVLNHTGRFLLAIVFLFFLSLFGFTKVPAIFMPKSDRNIVTMNITLPIGTRIEVTNQRLNEIEAFMKTQMDDSVGGILSWSTYVGDGAPRYDGGYSASEGEPNSAHILIQTHGDYISDQVINTMDQFTFLNYPEMETKIDRLTTGAAGDPVVIRISGKDNDRIFQIVDQTKKRLSEANGVNRVTDSWGRRTKKLVIQIDQSRAKRAGISSQDIAISLQTVLNGSNAGTFREDEKAIPIIMRADRNQQQDIAMLESLNVYAQASGKYVPLKQVADIVPAWQYSKIARRDLDKTVSVSATIKTWANAAAISNEMQPWLDDLSQSWPTGYSFEMGGDTEQSDEAMGAVADQLGIAVFVILLLLIGQFNSIRKTAIVLITIPLGIIGVVAGLLMAQSYFGFFTFLGIISLSGIVINNAIVLLDRIEIEQTVHKLTGYKAITQACGHRFRPILLSTTTTVIGLVPLWFGGGTMWEPLAISIIFGLLFATVLTLLFIPSLYKMFYRVKSG